MKVKLNLSFGMDIEPYSSNFAIAELPDFDVVSGLTKLLWPIPGRLLASFFRCWKFSAMAGTNCIASQPQMRR